LFFLFPTPSLKLPLHRKNDPETTVINKEGFSRKRTTETGGFSAKTGLKSLA
jgi:hypothetical protein